MIPALTFIWRNIVFLRCTEAKFAIILGSSVKYSWKDFIMVNFLRLIIFNYSFGNIETEILELIIWEI